MSNPMSSVQSRKTVTVGTEKPGGLGAGAILSLLAIITLAVISVMLSYWFVGNSRGVFVYGGIILMLAGVSLYTWKITLFPDEEVGK